LNRSREGLHDRLAIWVMAGSALKRLAELRAFWN
jgi:hypothetical protein